MSSQAVYEAKYGNSSLLKSNGFPKKDTSAKSTLVTYVNKKNNRSYCACLDCKKTFLSDSACPDCGEKTNYWSSTKDAFSIQPDKKHPSDISYFFRPLKQSTYVNRKQNGDATKMDFVVELEMFSIYPSNRMHVTPIKISTSYDFINRAVSMSIVNNDKLEEPVLLGATELKDAFFYSSNNRFSPKDTSSPLLECVFASAVGMKFTSKAEDKKTITGADILEKFASYQSSYAADTSTFGSFLFDDLDNIPVGQHKVAKTKKEANESSGDFGIHDAYRIFREKYHLTEDFHENKDKIFALVNMCVRYPAVVDWHLSKMDTEFQYLKEPMPESEKSQAKIDSLLVLSCQMATIDDKILKDLKKQNTGEHVEAYLQYLTFGKNPDNTTDVNHVIGRIAVDDAKNEGFGKLKSLRKNYNKNPLGTANLIYTAGTKIGFRDINHINQLVQMSEGSVDAGAFANHTIAPVQERAAIQFLKQYAKSHTPTQMIADIYHFDMDDRGRTSGGKYDMVGDCITMYKNCQKVGKVCMTKEETDKALLYDAKLKVSHMRVDENLTNNQIVDRLRVSWGSYTEACSKLVLDDLDKNGVPAEQVFFYGRDGKPLLSNRTLQEIHDELSAKQGTIEKLAHGNRTIPHTDEDRARFNREIGGYTFQLSPNTYDLVRTGEQMQICVGGYGDQAVEGYCHIVTMANAQYEKVACIEVNGTKENLSQFKAFRNSGIPVECVAAAKQWLRDANVNPDRCRDYTEGFGNPDYAPYGNRDFTAVRFPANPIPPASFIFHAYERELPKGLSAIENNKPENVLSEELN